MLEVKNLYKTFNKDTENEINVFKNFSLKIKEGKCTAILGANGSGKTTLLNIVAGSIEADSGEIYINNENISNLKEEERAIYMGRVHQNPSDGVSPSLTILENMSLADKKGNKFGLRKLIDKKRINYYKETLESLGLGLENQINSKVKYLSGGQRQSLSLLMAVMKNPKLLLLDEHTAALDPKTSKLILDKTRHLLRKTKITSLMISHNMRDAIKYSDYVVMLSRGNIIINQPSSDLTEEGLLKIYAKGADFDLGNII